MLQKIQRNDQEKETCYLIVKREKSPHRPQSVPWAAPAKDSDFLRPTTGKSQMLRLCIAHINPKEPRKLRQNDGVVYRSTGELERLA